MDLPMIMDNAKYAAKEYWEERYKHEESYDWFAKYEEIRDLIHETVERSQTILMLGCGNSALSGKMYQDGFQHITNTDYSAVVIESMKKKHKEMNVMDWQVVDIRDLTYPDESFDIVMEKGTLDALLVSEKDPWKLSEVSDRIIDNILCQVSRILKPNGKFISITFAQPHFRKPLYARSKYGWSIGSRTFGETFHYFYLTMVKGGTLSERDRWMEEQHRSRHKTKFEVTFVSDSEDEDFLIKNINIDYR